MQTLKQKTLNGLFWNLVERVGVRVAQFLPTILLARLLSPDEFGLIGMLAIFIALAQTFLDSGFGMALIQKRDADFTDECSIFYFNLLVGALIVVLLFFCAPRIAAFYRQPILVALTRWLSLDILLKSFSLIQTTLLTRSLDFQTQVKANLTATLLGGALGIAVAYAGWGVWSLVVQTLGMSAVRMLALWYLSPWRPARIFSVDALRKMFGFGSRMLFSSLVATFFDNFYQLFIGKVFSAADLGYYTRAASLKNISIDATSDTLARVLFPALANLQHDVHRLKRAYRKAILLATFIHFPLMLGLMVIAAPLVNVLLSEKWQPTILLFQLMCVAGVLYPLQIINLEILKVTGRSDLFFRLTLIKRGLMFAAIALTFRWGIPAMLLGHILNTIIAYALNSYYSDRLIGYPMRRQIADILPNLGFALLAAAGMWWLGAVLPQSNWVLVLAQPTAGALIFLLLNMMVRSEPLNELQILARDFLHLRRRGEQHA